MAHFANRQWGHRHTVRDADLNDVLSSCPLLTYLFLSDSFVWLAAVCFRPPNEVITTSPGTTNKIIENVSLVEQPLLEKMTSVAMEIFCCHETLSWVTPASLSTPHTLIVILGE